ncbi:MAG TPA: ROK family transcriptional regulator, partial [Spirochaetia bacterium]|nr:ROK family transcriptional regulator [Spirochaetia bacterium]
MTDTPRSTHLTKVYEIISSRRTISRPELAELTGLSRTAIGLYIDNLIQRGFVEESGRGSSRGGRPPMIIRQRPEAAYALGARMDDYVWNIVVTDLQARVVNKTRAIIPGKTPEVAVEALHGGVQRLLEESFDSSLRSRRLIPAIGVGTPGLVDTRAGIIKNAHDLGWFDVPIRKMIEERLAMKAYVVNRSKIGALAELESEESRGIKDLVYIWMGTGVAAGIIHDGKLMIGANSSAGELGHVTVEPNGPVCPCGNRGCLQQLISEDAITTRATERLKHSSGTILHQLTGGQVEAVTVANVFEAAEMGDPASVELVLEVARYLGVVVANLVNLLNPELVVLGGPVGEASELLTRAV